MKSITVTGVSLEGVDVKPSILQNDLYHSGTVLVPDMCEKPENQEKTRHISACLVTYPHLLTSTSSSSI